MKPSTSRLILTLAVLLSFPLLAYAASWVENGNNISYTAGRVGVGTTTPTSKIDVVGGQIRVQGEEAPTTGAGLELKYTGAQIGQILSFDRGAGAWKPLEIRANDVAFDIRGTKRVAIASDGKVGVGTTTPSATLDVVGTTKVSDTLTLGKTTGDLLTSSDPGVQDIRLTNDSVLGVNTIKINDTGKNEGIDWELGRVISVYEAGQGGHNAFQFDTTASYPFVFQGGNLGVGVDTPAEALEVDGNIKMSGNLVSDGDLCIGSCS